MRTAKLGDICEFIYGKGLSASKRVPGEYPVFGSNGCVGSHSEALASSPAIIVGRKGSIGQLNYSEKPCWPIDTTYFIDKTVTSENLRWLYYALTLLRLPDLNKATGVPGLNRNDAYEKKLVVPKPEEQRRIAAILDKADAVCRKRERSLTLADDLLKSTFLKMFGDPILNDRGWRTSPIGQTLTRIDSGRSPRCDTRPAKDGEFGILKVSAISSKVFLPSQNKAVIDGYVPDHRHIVQRGDLLFSRKNTYELVGATAVVEEDIENLAMPDLIFRLVPNSKKAITEFLWCALTQPTVREAMRKLAGGAAASMPNIGKARLSELEIISPPISEQERFLATYRKVVSTKNALRKSLVCANDMFASLSQRAFRGEI